MQAFCISYMRITGFISFSNSILSGAGLVEIRFVGARFVDRGQTQLRKRDRIYMVKRKTCGEQVFPGFRQNNQNKGCGTAHEAASGKILTGTKAADVRDADGKNELSLFSNLRSDREPEHHLGTIHLDLLFSFELLLKVSCGRTPYGAGCRGQPCGVLTTGNARKEKELAWEYKRGSL